VPLEPAVVAAADVEPEEVPDTLDEVSWIVPLHATTLPTRASTT
jgi:hypothetical protein